MRSLKKNLTQHKVNERMYMYKLELYQRIFLDFVRGNPISIETSGQNEENEVRLNGIVQDEEVQIEKP